MLDDTPSWQAYVGVLQGLYGAHTVRISIAGSKQTIAPITPDLLHLCHRAFYSPANLVLVVCGTCDFDRVCEMAECITPKQSARIASRSYGEETPEAAQPMQVRRMAVSRPTFILGIKDTVPSDSYRRQLMGELAARCVCCESAPLYETLYQNNLIDQSFDPDYFTFPEGACAMFSGESRNPEAVRDALLEEIRSIAAHGVDRALFERARRQLLGLKLRSADDPGSICRMQAEACFTGASCFDFYEILTAVTPEEIEARIREWAEPDRISLMVIAPAETEDAHG